MRVHAELESVDLVHVVRAAAAARGQRQARVLVLAKPLCGHATDAAIEHLPLAMEQLQGDAAAG